MSATASRAGRTSSRTCDACSPTRASSTWTRRSPIFHAFYDIDSFDIIPQYYDAGKPVLRGLFEDNDPTKRMIAIINFNTDVSNFWEFSGEGFLPIELSNEAYKLGVNYIVYGLTH